MTGFLLSARPRGASVAPPSRHEGTPGGLPVEDLLPQDVCVPAVLGKLAQKVEVHPAQLEQAVNSRAGSRRLGRPVPGMRPHAVTTRMPHDVPAGRWRWCRRHEERTTRPKSRGCRSQHAAARDSFVKPDLLHEGRVLHQAQQSGPGRHQRLARLLLGQPVQAAIEFTAVLVEERLELGVGWLIDDVLSERPWK